MKLEDLKGLGPARLNRLRAMGINSLRDLLYFFPIRFEDHVHETPVSSAWEGEVMIRGTVHEKPGISYFHGLSRVTARIQDGTGCLSVCWFNEPWIMQTLPVGQEILLYGKIQVKGNRRNLQNPRIVDHAGWFPVYRVIKGIPARTFHQLMMEALSTVEETVPETLSAPFREKWRLIPLAKALRASHFPNNLDELAAARRRIDFEKMLIYLMGVSLLRQRRQPGWQMGIPRKATDYFWKQMPFSPTGAQRRVLEEIAEDLRKDYAMSRLIQGDVGCGKTILAFGAMWLAYGQGFQSAMMAPTEVLARQHYEYAVMQLEPLGMRCALLTGSTKAAEKRKILKELKEGSIHAIFGTHALISPGVYYHQLGLVITDEQHRFGVHQRSALQEKGQEESDVCSSDSPRAPHVLVMSATPIPRTLALILYGDLSLSLVDEVPPGRKPVKTRLVPQEKRKDMYRFLRQQVQRGRQAYVVCPLVEDSEGLQDVKSAQTVYRELNETELKGLRTGLTWGSQKNEDKVETLRKYASGELDVLVATTVIEVGVNVPNATVMIIENAERYGLSQLHQLRGRVGRGEEESWCFLLSESTKKLKILCETNDGFLVAQKDLEMRGPGDLMGTRQSGDAAQTLAGSGDVKLLEEVQRSVRELETDAAQEKERAQIEALARSVFQQRNYHVALN